MKRPPHIAGRRRENELEDDRVSGRTPAIAMKCRAAVSRKRSEARGEYYGGDRMQRAAKRAHAATSIRQSRAQC